LLDYEAYCPRSAADSWRVARTVLSFALHDGQCRGAKLAVRSQDGISGFRWFEGIGNYTEVRRTATIGADSATISPDSPVVLNLKVLFSYPGMAIANQGHRGRAKMLRTSFRDYERQIRKQFTDMFARSGFDARRDIAGIILNRWEHAYLKGFFFGRERGRQRRQRFCALPHLEELLSQIQTWQESWTTAALFSKPSAVGQLLDRVVTD
jgi:hypothetical protein